MHKNKINISEKTFQNNINKITKLKNLNNKLQIKLCNIPKNKSRQKENSISINQRKMNFANYFPSIIEE